MDINLYELIDLAHVPGVNRELTASMEKWQKKGLNACEQDYQERLNFYYQKLFAGSRDFKTSEYKNISALYSSYALHAQLKTEFSSSDSLYWFELQQYEPWKWRIVRVEPLPMPYYHYSNILPKDIIEQISEVPVHPDKVVTMNKVHSDLLDKTMDIRFVRFSNTHIFGTVKEYSQEQVCWEGDLEAAFQTFFYYKNRFPDEVVRFMAGFMAELVPGLTGLAAVPVEKLREVSIENQEKELKLRQVIPPDWLMRVKGERKPWEEPVTHDHENNDINLYHLISLSQIPSFNQLLMLKLAELKNGALKQEIQEYEFLKNYYQENLLRYAKEDKDNGGAQPYWFVLSKFAPNDWGVTQVSPWPPAYDHYKEIISGVIFAFLTHTQVIPQQINYTALELPCPLWRKLGIQWVHFSGNCVMGKVCEYLGDLNTLLENQKQWLKGEGKLAAGDLYRLLFYHMRRCPETARSFIKRFMTEVLPGLKDKEKPGPAAI